jgi:hypothetical protein
MSQLKVYITRNFLESYVACRLKPFASFNVNEEKIIPFIGEVLNTGDCYMNFDFSSKIQDKNDNTSLTTYLKTLSLMKGGLKRESCLPYLEKIRNQNSIEPHEHPNYLLFSEKDNLEIDLSSKNLGFIPIIDTFKLYKRINEVCIKNIEPKENLTFSALSQYHYNAHSIVIEDPYFFSDESFNGKFLTDFLRYLLVEKNTKYISVIYTPYTSSYNKSTKQKEKIRDEKVIENVNGFKRILNNTKHVIDLIELPPRVLHDRNIYCDTNWITSGLGFKNTYNKTTELIFRPVGKYYMQLNKNLLALNKKIKQHRISDVKNPFLNKFKTP